ncbi:MAG: hypothetical protein FRX49_12148 [Trebouxia sp. A1-2]|nr:MAG: hypothetical protein FRX49_12148 [Trebouxia sp. A1-2]
MDLKLLMVASKTAGPPEICSKQADLEQQAQQELRRAWMGHEMRAPCQQQPQPGLPQKALLSPADWPASLAEPQPELVQPPLEPTAHALCLSAQRWSPALREHAKCVKRGEYMQRLAVDVVVMDETSLEDSFNLALRLQAHASSVHIAGHLSSALVYSDASWNFDEAPDCESGHCDAEQPDSGPQWVQWTCTCVALVGHPLQGLLWGTDLEYWICYYALGQAVFHPEMLVHETAGLAFLQQIFPAGHL